VWRIYGGLAPFEHGLARNRAKIARMFAINRDIFIRNTTLLFAFTFFYAQGARGGDVVLAGNPILHNLIIVASYFLDGFATAAEQMCGQSIGAQDAKAFRAAVRLTSYWSFAFAAALATMALLLGNMFIDFLSTEPGVRSVARDYLPFAALEPIAGALAYEFDGVFVGATWTHDMRNMMLTSLAIYIASFHLLRPFSNSGLWVALLIFLLSRGLTQAWRYRKLSALSFPLAQSAAIAPVASGIRG
jgi:multidrug resistance protein, MATE family